MGFDTIEINPVHPRSLVQADQNIVPFDPVVFGQS